MDQPPSSLNCFPNDLSGGSNFMDKTHGLASEEGHRFDVPGCMNVGRYADEPLNGNLCTGDGRVPDNSFVGSEYLRLSFAIDPFADERSSQRSVRSMWPSVSEKNRAYRIFLASGDESSFVAGMCVGFRSGQKTRPHRHAIGSEA